MASDKPNLILIGIDSLRADHMSLYGYPRLTTPHVERMAEAGTVFEKCFSPYIPTTSGYGTMLTGMDCFSTGLVALRHKGDMAPGVRTLAEILRDHGYESTCVGFKGNPASRGFDNYIQYSGWGRWSEGRSTKAENLNAVTLPELDRLAAGDKPFFLFMRHLDPHAPYLPPGPFERMFYHGDECDPANKSLEPVFAFKPFRDFFATWFPPGCTDKDYIIAQYDGAAAYLDACLADIFTAIDALHLTDDTLLVLDSDHGETLYDHDCFFDHHGLYEPTLRVPLVFRMPGKVPAGKRIDTYTTLTNVTPTILELMEIDAGIDFDGVSLAGEMSGQQREGDNEFYITECTWMRKHGWRTPEWKYIHALEPDFHFKPEIELYDLVNDPEESTNLADQRKDMVETFEKRMRDWIAAREKATGRPNPITTNPNWHGHDEIGGPFTSSRQAYDTLHIGDPDAARKLQSREADK